MNQSDTFQVETLGDVTVITLGTSYETIDGPLVKETENKLLAVVGDPGCRALVLDMTDTRFFGSSFIESLIRVWNTIKSREGSSLSLCGLQPYCEEVLTVTHLNQIWGLFPSREAALSANQSARA